MHLECTSNCVTRDTQTMGLRGELSVCLSNCGTRYSHIGEHWIVQSK